MPPLKVFSSESSVVVCAEIPGLDPQDIEISLLNDTLIIRGERKPEIEMEAHSCHRQERCFGRFSRSLQLPYAVEAEQVQARFSGGLLQITLPRAEAAKPRKINVVSE